MNAALGSAGILLAFASAVAGVAVLSWRLFRIGPAVRSGGAPGATSGGLGSTVRLYTTLALIGALVATGAMEHALVTHDFSIAYVAQNSSRETPLLYVVTGMWSSLAGSILLWGLVLALYLFALGWIYRRRADQVTVAWVALVGLVTAAFFFGLMLGPSNPFVSVHPVPHDGVGPNPLLQDRPLVAFHPPLLYAGLVGFTIPFGFAIAGLVTGDLGSRWAAEVRRWTLFSWGCLGGGIVLGMWWSYQVLGWGGFWGWDPVENAAFVPWLVATAFLHSVVVHERRGLLRVWNVSLVSATFCLTILCTFLTRSGVLESVHAFSNSDIGPYLIAFFGAAVVVSISLVAWRGELLRSGVRIDSPLSREGAFLANNVAFSLFAFVVLLGTVFPLFVEAVSGQQVTVGSPYFDKTTMPVVIALLFLMAVGPVLPWRRASAETSLRRLLVPACVSTAVLVVCVASGLRSVAPLVAYLLASFAGASALRQLAVEVRAGARWSAAGARSSAAGARSSAAGARSSAAGARWSAAGARSSAAGARWSAALRQLTGRSGGGMVVHLGVVIMAVGMASSLSYGHRTELTMRPGQVESFDGHSIQYRGTRDVVYANRSSVEATVVIDHDHVGRPALSVFQGGGPAVGTPAVDSGVEGDVYVTLDMTPASATGVAVIGVVVQPLVMWLWIGGATIALGTALALVRSPSARRRDVAPCVDPAIERELVSL